MESKYNPEFRSVTHSSFSLNFQFPAKFNLNQTSSGLEPFINIRRKYVTTNNRKVDAMYINLPLIILWTRFTAHQVMFYENSLNVHITNTLFPNLNWLDLTLTFQYICKGNNASVVSFKSFEKEFLIFNKRLPNITEHHKSTPISLPILRFSFPHQSPS